LALNATRNNIMTIFTMELFDQKNTKHVIFFSFHLVTNSIVPVIFIIYLKNENKDDFYLSNYISTLQKIEIFLFQTIFV
jgi:hypothetical protein